jgi:hypothetical protein
MPSVTKHEHLFAGLISYMNISEFSLRGFDKAVTLSLCNDELGLLPNWMFRADMISVMLTQKRAFDVIYERNDNAVSLLTFESPQNSMASLDVRDSYSDVPHYSDMPSSLLNLIAAQAISDSLRIDQQNRQVEILPLVGFFKLPENGQGLRFPSLLAIEGHLLSKLGQKVRLTMNRIYENNLSMVR